MSIHDTHYDPKKRCAIADFVDSLPEDEKKDWAYLGNCGIIQRESRKAKKARKRGGKSWDSTIGAENKHGEIIITRSGNSQIHSCVNHAALLLNEGVNMEHMLQHQRPDLNPGESPDTQNRFHNRTEMRTERSDKAKARLTKRKILENKENRTRRRTDADADATPVPNPNRTPVEYFNEKELKPKIKFNAGETETPTAPTAPTETKRPGRERKNKPTPAAPTPATPTSSPTINIPKARVNRLFNENELEDDESL